MAQIVTVRGANGVTFEVDLSLECNASVQRQIDAGDVVLLDDAPKAAAAGPAPVAAADDAPEPAPAPAPKPRQRRTRTTKK